MTDLTEEEFNARKAGLTYDGKVSDDSLPSGPKLGDTYQMGDKTLQYDGSMWMDVNTGSKPDLTESEFNALKSNRPKPIIASPVPVESQLDRNSFLQNYYAGIGQSAVNTGRGIGQIARHLMPDRLANGIGLPTQEDIDNAKKLDAPLLSTGGGMVGNIAGNIALTALPGMAAAKYGKAIPYIGKGISALGELVSAPKGLLPNIAGGAIIGATQPVASEDSRAGNTLLGGVAGGFLPAVAGLYGLGKFGAGVWGKKYSQDLAGNLLNSESSLGADTLASRIRQGMGRQVPDYNPTLAESVSNNGRSDIGISTLQRAMQSIDPTGQGSKFKVQDHVQGQNKALLDSLNRFVLPDPAYANMEGVRREATKNLYDNLPLVQSSDELERILNSPAGKEALPLARKIAGNQYRSIGEDLPSDLTMSSGHAFPDLNSVDMSAPSQTEKALHTHWTAQPINYQKDNMLTAIRKMGGINKELVQSTYGNRVWDDGLGHGLFRNNGGQSIDDLNSRLQEHGYLPEGSSPYDLMNSLYDKSAGDMFSTSKHGYDDIYHQDMTEQDTLMDSIGKLVSQLEKKNAPKVAKEKAPEVFASAEDKAYQGRDLQSILQGMKATVEGTDSRQLKKSYSGPLGDLINHLNVVMPELSDANRLYADKSKILNQSDIFSALLGSENKKLIGTANAKLNEDQFLSLLGNEKTLLKRAGDLTGVTTLDQALSRTGKNALDRMKTVIRNRASTNVDASALGSPTAQNLSTGRVVANNMVEQGLSSLGLPKSIAGNRFVQTLIDRPSSWVFKIPEEGVRENIARSFVDPEYAATLSEMAIKQAKEAKNKKISKAMRHQIIPASGLISYLTQQ